MKVAINGIGVAGPTLAYWLRRLGHEPILFEKAPALRSGGFLVDFWGVGYAIAERMGIVANLHARGYEIERMRMVDRDGREEAQLSLAPARHALHGRFVSIARSEVSAALFRACEGIPARFGVSIVALEEKATGCVVTLSDGTREPFDVVAGADGLHSAVRALAFGPEAQFERFLGCHIAACRIRGYPHRDELTHVSLTVRNRQVGRVSLRHDETLVLFVWRPESGDIDVPRDRDAQHAALRCAFGDMGWEAPALLEAMDEALDFYFDRVSQIHLPRWSNGSVVLLGDAAVCPSLLAGEGTGLAMLEAYILAGELHRANGDKPRALDAYEGRLRRFVRRKQDSALSLRGFFAPRTALGVAARKLGVRAFSLPRIATPLLGRVLRDDIDLPAYENG